MHRPVSQENLNSWMLDKMGRDQFVIRSGDNTEVFWNDGKRSRMDLVRDPDWTRQQLRTLNVHSETRHVTPLTVCKGSHHRL